MQKYTINKKQGLYSTLKYYSCPGCGCVIYRGDRECQNCNAELEWRSNLNTTKEVCHCGKQQLPDGTWIDKDVKYYSRFPKSKTPSHGMCKKCEDKAHEELNNL